MTFSIVARCSETRQLGIAISSSSIAVAARCPWARAGVGAVATQNVTLPSLGLRILDRLENEKLHPREALEMACNADAYRDYRQVTVIDAQGRTALFTGREALGVHEAIAGDQCVAAGNLLSSPDVIAAMVRSFETSTGLLGDRLVAAMRAAVEAGGEAGPVRSAGMKIVDAVEWPIADLRVDWIETDPIDHLAGLWTAYKPQMRDYLTRALNPTAAPSYGVPGDE
ncbi:MAG TPA: DUF1028 domain-containing protein [Ramlibacter sp.]|uniref:DUF1028 domain-containing protein n=1 Tax=Ramlibacter sp. TaxID=1917967 RepID=UPI002CA5D787|nr:DUF1028 domain-containing protein [Ramlibacter sp.]HVZ44112.1 DUF1028 domain-containing protein [Ramlibacter sp.]